MIQRPRQIDIVIGIDPDVDRNGMAVLDTSTAQYMTIEAVPFPELITALYAAKSDYRDRSLRVVIEAGWLNRSNWHVKYCDSKAVAAAKGNNAGRNEECGRKIAEMCRFWQIPHELIKPLTKVWRGRERKITAQELQSLTGWTRRTNQEMRDAALLAWVWAGLPM